MEVIKRDPEKKKTDRTLLEERATALPKTLLEEWEATGWETLCANYVADKRFLSRIYKEFSYNEKTTQFFKWAKDSNRSFTKEDV